MMPAFPHEFTQFEVCGESPNSFVQVWRMAGKRMLRFRNAQKCRLLPYQGILRVWTLKTARPE
jgi:hypothetical protein